ncbi:unnamed protein product [Arctia plantaginis]|uniref:Uncharacterized protein n=1 Tax=Arctia plantaginis TaxID=874455 RepID=A0A8S0ZTV4_ARCPL|nr:unnamed protein product [Arctia plantaginis]
MRKLSLLIIVAAVTAVPRFPVLYAPMAEFFMPPPPPMPLGVPIPIPVPIVNVKPICAPTTTLCPCKPKIPPPNCGCKCLHPIPPRPIIAPYLPSFIPPYRLPYKPPYIPKPIKYISSSSSSETSSDSDDSDYSYRKRRRRRRRKRKRYGIFRANGRRFNNNIRDQELQPVISYVSENGDVKFRRRINKDNSALLLQQQVLDDKFNDKSRSRFTPKP